MDNELDDKVKLLLEESRLLSIEVVKLFDDIDKLEKKEGKGKIAMGAKGLLACLITACAMAKVAGMSDELLLEQMKTLMFLTSKTDSFKRREVS